TAVALQGVRVRRRAAERLAEDGEALLAGIAVWLAGDPAVEAETVRRRLAAATHDAEAARAEAARHGAAARALTPRVEALRALLGDAWLLDPPDHAARARELEMRLRAARDAAAEARRTARYAEALEADLDALRRPPLSAADAAGLVAEAAELRAERDRLDAAVDALDFVGEHLEALAWSDAPARLAGAEALAPALTRQAEDARAEQSDADARATEAEGAYDAAHAAWQDADGAVRVARAERDGAAAALAAFGVEAPSEAAVEAAEAAVRAHEGALRAEESRRDRALTERGSAEQLLAGARKRLEEAKARATIERGEAEPSFARWEALRARATAAGLLDGALPPGREALGEVRGAVNFVQEARTRRQLLYERLKLAQGGAALLKEHGAPRDDGEGAFADEYVDLWLEVREWLRRRLPAQVAESDDPREALLRLRDRLDGLEERLARQEDDLRGASEDVARGIDVQVRKARGQVARLNRNLDGVVFGGIRGIRVRVDPVERMEQVLRALRSGDAQGLLFQNDLPIEEALDEIFRKYGGGGKTGGQKLLDYREYLHLHVEIRRLAGGGWESANPTRLSTGEAIGVGAALMMVVLTEWERDANLLRGRKAHGSLRFLFLDEANRLSHDNLGTLFDLCRTLDLQLLIAAPEVARAEGNTTYRLVRRIAPDGREEVLVSGRRTKA
ncbi:MAG TPA: SbcC/MukB-like Walker B domain-containing protein, partial [Planctomycetota bacterium]|nr:SbcC/MukB-like Walker B domain-containing protein [Planctomycetota bacterium]